LSRRGIASNSPRKSKLFNLLTVCLATSGLLAPAQAAVGNCVKEQISLEQAQHLVCVKEGEHFLCDVENSSDRDSLRDSGTSSRWATHRFEAANASQESAPNQEAVKEAEATKSLKSSTVPVVGQLLTPAQQGSIANILIGFAYFVPCGLGLGIFLYDKYCAYRAAVIKEQIEILERLWKQSTQQ
jgi:hypothetical protein